MAPNGAEALHAAFILIISFSLFYLPIPMFTQKARRSVGARLTKLGSRQREKSHIGHYLSHERKGAQTFCQ